MGRGLNVQLQKTGHTTRFKLKGSLDLVLGCDLGCPGRQAQGQVLLENLQSVVVAGTPFNTQASPAKKTFPGRPIQQFQPLPRGWTSLPERKRQGIMPDPASPVTTQGPEDFIAVA